MSDTLGSMKETTRVPLSLVIGFLAYRISAHLIPSAGGEVFLFGILAVVAVWLATEPRKQRDK